VRTDKTIKNGQPRDTGKIRHTRHRTSKTQRHNTTQKTIKNGQPTDIGFLMENGLHLISGIVVIKTVAYLEKSEIVYFRK
jgi:hypothetical protein